MGRAVLGADLIDDHGVRDGIHDPSFIIPGSESHPVQTTHSTRLKSSESA
jgi:hypothetical protein